jgi:polysaccharide chain length determinant protein (PEP-CTERM system associated)
MAPSATGVRLAQLRQELAELRTRFSDRYPDVIRVRTEIAALEREVAEAQARPPDAAAAAPAAVPPDPQVARMRQALTESEAELKILKAEEERLRLSIAGYQRRVQETPAREQQFKELARDYESTRELHASLLKRHAESQIAESMEHRQKGEQFRVIEPAVPGANPVAPNRGRLAGMGLALAAGAALGIVLLAEQLNTSFHTVQDLRAFTRVPVLAAIPTIVTPGDRRRARRLRQLGAVASLASLLVIVGLTWWLAHGNEYLASLLAGRKL